ncbi:MAG TPA: hypothetical protein VJS43_19615 [Candidatus Acidoferrales bacterium]|nr:hypothetical protein [Candidatus Acidoferrales bacterium]
MRALVQGRIGIALRGTQAVQLSASSRELLAQLGHLVLQPALGGLAIEMLARAGFRSATARIARQLWHDGFARLFSASR